MKQEKKLNSFKLFEDTFNKRNKNCLKQDFYSIPLNIAVLTEIGKPIYLRYVNLNKNRYGSEMQMQTVFATLSILLNKCSLSIYGEKKKKMPYYFENHGKLFVFLKKHNLFFVLIDLEKKYQPIFHYNQLNFFALYVNAIIH